MSKVEIRTLESVTANDATATALINSNFEALQQAIENTVSRDGSVPNYMDSNLDLNSYKLINVGNPENDHDVITKKYFEDSIGDAASYATQAVTAANAAASSAQSAAVFASEAISTIAQAEADIQQAARDAAEAATSASIATTKAEEASTSATTATTQAGIATTQAGIATTQADIATTKAGEAATSATTATTKAEEAATSANTATTKAEEAATSANTATTKAEEAARDAAEAATSMEQAATSASTATTQAGIATTQAGIATTKAGEAATSANTATTKAGEAKTSEINAHIWVEGTDEEVENLGGEHSAKTWEQIIKNSAPTATISQTSTGATITVTDYQGTTAANLYNGEKGDTGDDGFSPIATVSKVGTEATITITDKNGTTTAKVYDGVESVSDVKVNGTSVVSGGVANVSVPTNNNQLINGAGYITSSALTGYATENYVDTGLSGKQATLVSGTNIKSVNGSSLLGSGNITIGGAVDSVNGQTGAVVLTASDVGALPDSTVIPTEETVSGWGFTKNVGTVTSVNDVAPVNGNVSISIPTVNNPTISFTQGGVSKGSFTLNQSTGATIALDAGGGSVTTDGTTINKNLSGELQTIGVINQNDATKAIKSWSGTKAQYAALPAKDADTLYNITDDSDAQTYEAYTKSETDALVNAKQDKITGVSGVGDYVVEWKAPTSADPSWYRKYKSGWLEQGGFVASTANDYQERTVTFPKTMANNNYTVQVTAQSNFSNTSAVKGYSYYNPTTTSIKVFPQKNTIGVGVSWQITGMGA